MRLIGLFATVGLALAVLATPSARQAFMPVSEVKAGMVGVGRTVFAGDKLEEFRATSWAFSRMPWRRAVT